MEVTSSDSQSSDFAATQEQPVNQEPHQSLTEMLSATHALPTSTHSVFERPPTQPPVASLFANEANPIAMQSRPLTVENYFEPDIRLEPDVTASAAPWLSYTDPVLIGLLSEPESRFLFRQCVALGTVVAD